MTLFVSTQNQSLLYKCVVSNISCRVCRFFLILIFDCIYVSKIFFLQMQLFIPQQLQFLIVHWMELYTVMGSWLKISAWWLSALVVPFYQLRLPWIHVSSTANGHSCFHIYLDHYMFMQSHYNRHEHTHTCTHIYVYIKGLVWHGQKWVFCVFGIWNFIHFWKAVGM